MHAAGVFSGIGGFELAARRVGITTHWMVENDEHCRDILKRHFPQVPLYNDVTKVHASFLTKRHQAIDLLVGGFPCQDVSVAGHRAGLDGARSILFWQFARLLDELRPRFCLIENVPGLLSSRRGRDMGAVLGALGNMGYGFAYRVLDAQGFGVPQRRKRVFIVGCLGDARRAAEVLLEPESGGGHLGTQRRSREEVAGTLEARTPGGGFPGTDGAAANHVVPFNKVVRSGARDEDGNLPAEVWREEPIAPTLSAFDGASEHRAVTVVSITPKGGQGADLSAVEGITVSNTLSSLNGELHDRGTRIVTEVGVRRLMPIECERLQGFPDGWTDEQSDTIRYRQLGNAVAVPVAEWLLDRFVQFA